MAAGLVHFTAHPDKHPMGPALLVSDGGNSEPQPSSQSSIRRNSDNSARGLCITEWTVPLDVPGEQKTPLSNYEGHMYYSQVRFSGSHRGQAFAPCQRAPWNAWQCLKAGGDYLREVRPQESALAADESSAII